MFVIKMSVDTKKKKENNYNHCHYSNLNQAINQNEEKLADMSNTDHYYSLIQYSYAFTWRLQPTTEK